MLELQSFFSLPMYACVLGKEEGVLFLSVVVVVAGIAFSRLYCVFLGCFNLFREKVRVC